MHDAVPHDFAVLWIGSWDIALKAAAHLPGCDTSLEGCTGARVAQDKVKLRKKIFDVGKCRYTCKHRDKKS